MSFSKFLKDYSWLIFPILFASIIILRLIFLGIGSLLTSATAALFIALLSSLYNHASWFRKPIVYLYYVIFKIYFEWEIHSVIKGNNFSINQIDEKKIRDIIVEIFNEAGLDKRINDISVSLGTREDEKYIAYVPVYGINLIFDTYEEQDVTEERAVLRIKGQTLLPYKKTKSLLQKFLKSFFKKIEDSIEQKSFTNYGVKVFPSTHEVNFFENQFIKNIKNATHFSIIKETGEYRINVNSRYLEINTQFREGLIGYASNLLLRLK